LRALRLRDGRNALSEERRIALTVRRPFRASLEIREWGTDLFTLEEIIHEGSYNRVAELVPDCGTIVDLGANIGLATLYLASKYPKSRIISIEPHPETFALLTGNVAQLSRAGRCVPVHAAIWNRSGVNMSLSAPNPLAFAGVNVSESAESESGILSVTMQELIERYGLSTIDLLKVDIEGAEVELFRGDISWMAQVGAIAIEFHGDSREKSGFDSAIAAYGMGVIDTSAHTVIAARLNPTGVRH
jgi:FkbM family methyltransferase